MRHRIWVLALSVLLILFLAVTTSAADKKFQLRWGHYLAKGPFLEVEQNFAKAIEERTNGRVTIQITYAGGLGKGEELLTLAGRGAIDMGTAAPGYYANELLFWKAYQMPFVFNSPREAIKVLIKSYETFPIYKQEMDKMNLHWLFQQPLGAYYFTGPSPACDNVAGLKGKKIRSFGEYFPKGHMAIGAVPVNVFPVEVYEALQRGVIDYSFLNAGNIQQYRLWEVAKYNCGPLTAFTGHNICIGNPTWNKLPKDIQEIFDDQAKKTQQEYVDWVDEYEVQAVKNITGQGGVFKAFPPDELDKWRKAAPDFIAEWVKDMDAKGHGDTARQVAKLWREMTGK
ncbi:MAG: TRAP transporter substrate-binding protein DctP [Pseudomonadota bacterium]